MPVAHTFDLTHSPYGSLVHQQRTSLKPTRLFFCRFFLAQKKQATPKPRSTNATNRRAARAVAKNIPATKQHTKKHTYTYIYPPSARHTPVCGLPVRGRVLRIGWACFGASVARCECCECAPCMGCGLARVPRRQVIEWCKVRAGARCGAPIIGHQLAPITPHQYPTTTIRHA
jgi:hypothetical protein